MSTTRMDPKRRSNARIARQRGEALAVERATLLKHETGSFASAYRRRGGMTAPESRGLTSFAGLRAGDRIVDRSSHAVTVARDGELLGTFAIGDWGKP